MVFLTAGQPDWQLEFPALAGGMIEAVTRGAPMLSGVYVRGVSGAVFLSAETLSGRDRLGAVWAAAKSLASYWPGWLEESEVGLTVSVPGLKVDATPAAMRHLGAGTVGRPQWLTQCVVKPG